MIRLVGVTTAVAESASELALPLPGHRPGDLLWCVWFLRATATATYPTTDGWTLRSSIGGATDRRVIMLTNVVGPRAIAAPVTSFSATAFICGTAMCFRARGRSVTHSNASSSYAPAGAVQDIGAIVSPTMSPQGRAFLVMAGKTNQWDSVSDLSGDGWRWRKLVDLPGAASMAVWFGNLGAGDVIPSTLTSKTAVVTGGDAGLWWGKSYVLQATTQLNLRNPQPATRTVARNAVSLAVERT